MLYSRSLLQDAIGYGIMIANGCRIFSFAEICLGRGWLVVRGSLINCCRLVRFQCVLLCQYKGFVFVTLVERHSHDKCVWFCIRSRQAIRNGWNLNSPVFNVTFCLMQIVPLVWTSVNALLGKSFFLL